MRREVGEKLEKKVSLVSEGTKRESEKRLIFYWEKLEKRRPKKVIRLIKKIP